MSQLPAAVAAHELTSSWRRQLRSINANAASATRKMRAILVSDSVGMVHQWQRNRERSHAQLFETVL
jgi:hypothetical protein